MGTVNILGLLFGLLLSASAVMAETPESAEGFLQMAEGSLQSADGSFQMAEGSLQSAEGSLQMAEGSQPAEGSLQMAEGSQPAEGSLQPAEGSLQSPTWSRDHSREKWVATWSSPPAAPGSAFELPKIFENQTIRQTARISLGGQRFRVRISNAYGTQPLQIGAAHLAVQATGASIVPGTDRTLKFGGLPSIAVPAGGLAISDPVDLPVAAKTNITISLYLPTATGPATYLEDVNQNTYISGVGDFTGVTDLPVVETATSRYFVAVVEVVARNSAGVVVIGDSITKGATSANWPQFLFERLHNNYGTQKVAVVNQGIGCGRILRDFCGPNAVARFDRDVLAVSGVTHVILALGLVDIIFPSAAGNLAEIASASEIIVGLKQLIERARAKGLRVYGATITPIKDTSFAGVYTPENEATRKAVNRWIRYSGAFDAVIDFDRVVGDPADPARFWPIYTVDGLHPNDAGNQLMADAINLSLFE